MSAQKNTALPKATADVLFSSCINTSDSDYRITVKSIICADKRETRNDLNVSEYKDSMHVKRYWVIPVCDQNHWHVLVVARPRSNKPSITVFDSMKKKKYASVDLIKWFLKQKYAAEHNGKCKKIEVDIANIPQQTNANDSGLFAIRSADLFLKGNAQYYYDLIKITRFYFIVIYLFYANVDIIGSEKV
ncbi:hypothetical protein EDC94DRAFT_655384 [Helicostylum pulchrum]|nr:hypothetical protein EDC94DRAFT_655384 [Helicostylum pulchrum]